MNEADVGNIATLAGYEACAAHYAEATAPHRGPSDRPSLQRFTAILPPDGPVLEIGSGPGWDADWLEQRGVTIRRTDATAAFVEMQCARGVTAERLDVVRDELGGPYAGVLAMYVFQHVERGRLAGVFAKIAQALAVGGALLFSLREGDRDFVEEASTGSYHITEWRKAELDDLLRGLGFTEFWSALHQDEDGRWITIVARKPA